MGGALATILTEILNASGGGAEPMVIEGTYDGSNFTPSSYSVNIETVANFVKSGGVVICHYTNTESAECWTIVTNVEYDIDSITILRGLNSFRWDNA